MAEHTASIAASDSESRSCYGAGRYDIRMIRGR